eukprot:g10143.t1
MYASRPVIEGTNLDANVRQAVNHFEFNDVLVSKKGLWQSLRTYCASTGVPVETVVPQTFYLSGGAVRSATPPSSRKMSPGSSSSSKRGENGESDDDGNGNGGGCDDRTEFLALCAEMNELSGTSSCSSHSSSSSSSSSSPSPCSAGLLASPETAATATAKPELITASKDVAAREPRPSSTSSTTAEDVGPAAVEVDTLGFCSPEALDELSTCDRSRNASPAVRAVVRSGENSAVERNFSPQEATASCPPETVLRSASPPPPPLSPSSSPCGRCLPGGSPEASVEELPPPRRESDIAGSALLAVHTHSPAAGALGTKKSAHGERRKGARDVETAVEGPALGGGPEGGGAQKTGATANRSGSQPKKMVKSGQDDGEPDSSLVAQARRNRVSGDITVEEIDRNRRTSVGIKRGGAAGSVPTWVVKPAANTNCGFGIQVCCSLQEVLDVVDAKDNRAGRSGWVVQRYIERPLLVRGRKFDIRLFVLVVADPSTRSWRRKSRASPPNLTTNSDGSDKSANRAGGGGQPTKELGPGKGLEPAPAEEESLERERVGLAPADGSSAGAARQQPPSPCPLRAWCHQDAYVRTSSVRYSNDPRKVKDKFIHLTNNAVQRRSPSYGQEEPGNKLTMEDLQEWLDGDESGHQGHARGWVEQTLRPRMHSLVATSVAAAATAGINKRGRPYAFELLGYDFMVDDDLRVWLIEVNSNPCLEFVCPLLQGMIVRVIEDTLSIALDSVFRPPEKHRSAAATGLGGADSEESGNGFRRVYPAAE